MDDPARTAGNARPGRLPDFFIVGHHKCGTTALYEILRRHPQIYMPGLKEPRFFETPPPGRLRWSRPERCPTTLAAYEALFAAARPGQLAGEASPQYLSSLGAAQAIGQLQPAARIIAIFREPSTFVRSLHMQLVQDHVETENDLAKAIEDEDLRRKGIVDPLATEGFRRYSDHVKYAEQLKRFHDVFPPERVLSLIYDDFRTDNDATLRTVLRFLGAVGEVPVVASEANPSVRVRSMRVERVLQWFGEGRHPAARAVKTAVKAGMPRSFQGVPHVLRQRIAYGRPRPADSSLMRDLRIRYRHEVVALSECIDRDLVSLWGYDAI